MKPIKAGKLRNRVQFQSRSTTRDAANQPVDSWTTFYTCRAKIDVLRAQILYQTAEFISQSTYTVEIRFPGSTVPPISAQNRIVDQDDGTIYVIDAPTNTERRDRKLEILCHVLNESD